MPSMDQGYSFGADTSSFFSEEPQFLSEKQVGFWKAETATDQRRTEGMASYSGNKAISSSPINKLHVPGANGVNKMELSQSYILSNGRSRFSLEHNLAGNELMTGPSFNAQRVLDHGSIGATDRLSQLSSYAMRNHVSANGSSYENGLLSASLPDMLKKKLSLSFNNAPLSESAGNANHDEDEPFESMEEIEAQTIGNLLPDDDDLLSGVLDNVGYSYQFANGDDVEDDIFYSGGGIELETDDNNISNKAPGHLHGGVSSCMQVGVNGVPAGEHPFGEHPSRTLFVRNINSNVEDAELKTLFEQYGDIRTLYTACKHRGFVMISYYDIRSATNAMRALQNKPLRRRKLDIHYSIPKDNPSEKDINQGTLVVFNLDSTVSNDELLQIFGAYGEVKEIRETPHKRHHKFVEFYDIRAAEAALALNRSDIAGKKIKLEPSRPGGARRSSLIQQLSAEMEQEELNGCDQDTQITTQSNYFGSVPLGPITSNGIESGSVKNFQPAIRPPVSPLLDSTFRGISSSVSQTLSSPVRISSAASHCNQPSSGDLSQSVGQMNFGYQGIPNFHPNSLPEYNNGVLDGIPYDSSTMSSLGMNIIRQAETVDSRHLKKATPECLKSSAFDHSGGAFGISGNGSCTLHGHQYGWNNSNAFQHQVPNPVPWSNSPSFMSNISAHSHGLPRTPSHMLNTALPLHHHVGSAPAINATIWDRRHAYPGDATDSHAFHPGSLGSMGFSGSPQLHQLELASRNIFPHAGGSSLDHSISPSHVGIPSPQQRGQVYHDRNHMVHMPSSFEGSTDRIRSRRNDSSANQTDNKKQYELDIDRILLGEDTRTTLMIKNIPNKYSAKMLLAAIDENHRGTYDFIYLPIDFKNKCNVGYAFINMTAPQHIVPFYQTFNGKKWEKFNSEKVASLAYARIQGKPALVAHFQNSSLMNEDKRCRPILFHSDGPNAGDQEPFPTGTNIRSRPGRSRASSSNEEQHQESPSICPDGEASSDALESPSSSTRDSE